MYQVDYNSTSYYLLKTWKDLIEKDVYLDNEPVYNQRFKKKINKRNLLDMILDISENLALGYQLKEMYLHFNEMNYGLILYTKLSKKPIYQNTTNLYRFLKTGEQKY